MGASWPSPCQEWPPAPEQPVLGGSSARRALGVMVASELACINRSTASRSGEAIIPFHLALVRPRPECSIHLCSPPWDKGNVSRLEWVQWTAAKIGLSCELLLCEEKLRDWTCYWAWRRKGLGDLQQLCKGLQESEAKFFTVVHGGKTRDSRCELESQRSVYNMFSTLRCVKWWDLVAQRACVGSFCGSFQNPTE